ncbi:MAG: hypothetical protein FWE31_02830 [Firmicutes bacterium]|nr:hypothetical protein [Bacillota bacterium]
MEEMTPEEKRERPMYRLPRLMEEFIFEYPEATVTLEGTRVNLGVRSGEAYAAFNNKFNGYQLSDIVKEYNRNLAVLRKIMENEPKLEEYTML